MNGKTVSEIMLTLLLIPLLTMPFSFQPLKAKPTTTITVPDDYPTIQGAINAASPRDTVYVRTGTYYENVVVSKPLSLVGESREITIIDGSWSGIVVEITADNALVSNFTIRRSGSPSFDLPTCGIWLAANYCSITNNLIRDNKGAGIRVYSSSDNMISGNDITENDWYGMWLGVSSNNMVSGNNVTNNVYGIEVVLSSNNTLYGNNITANYFHGIYLSSSSGNTISRNIISGNDRNVNLYYGFYLGSSSKNIIYGNDITANYGYGFYHVHSSGNIISGNNIAANEYCGFFLGWSSNNIVARNNITNNRYGIAVWRCYGNFIYHNNFIDNTQQIFWRRGTNLWDDGYPSGGNYWSNYEEIYTDAEELNCSGIWDTPYFVDRWNRDNYPLMEPWTLPRTIDELKTKIEELDSEGQIDNQGIVNSLIAKLNVAQKLVDSGKIDQAKTILEAFIQQVQNLSGIHLTPEAADILIESAEHRLSHL